MITAVDGGELPKDEAKEDEVCVLWEGVQCLERKAVRLSPVS